VRRPKATPIHELERYMRCKDCSQVRGHPYKRSHLVALRATKISASDRRWRAHSPTTTPLPAKLTELANACEPAQDGRIYIEKINAPFIYQLKGTAAEYKAGLDLAIAKRWLSLYESGTYVIVRFTEADSRAGSYPHGATSD
jgi:hypothetical protein